MNAFKHEPRKQFSPKERARIFLEKEGKCHWCRRTLRPGESWIVEHVIALERGGDNSEGNLDITCSGCKILKDAADHRGGAKAKRVATKHTVPTSVLRANKRSGFGSYTPNIKDINDE